MAVPDEKNNCCNKEKEELKKQFEDITDKYSLFEGTDKSALSEKLLTKLAKTKEEIHKIIEAM